jgi:ABC-type sugar transport system ATPase subunit
MTSAPPTPGTIAVAVRGLCKRYPGVTALDDVSADFRSGEVTAVMGENGAGKSTLMSIVAGLQRPDEGTVEVGGRVVHAFTPHELLLEHRVALVPQEIALCRDRSVAENVMLGLEPGAFPSRRQMEATTRLLLEQIETPLDPRRPVTQLSVAQQQLVLIVRALARECRVLILDEPTTSLTAQEVGHLFRLLRRLRAGGTAVVYVSHRLPEIFELSDRVHVLRDGRNVASYDTSAVTPQRLVEAMVGRAVADHHQSTGSVTDRTVLEVTNFSGAAFSDVSLRVRAGEVVGVAGLPDSGRSELVAALFGAVRSTGSVAIDGQPVRLRSPRDAVRLGLAYVPAERRSQGIFPDQSVGANATILEVETSARFGVVRRSSLKRLAEQRLAEFDVRGSVAGNITGLSGGNQQKVVLSRWLARQPRLILLDDPTRGVDVGAKAEIHQRLAEAAQGGAAVVMASSDLLELLRSCDRIVVMAGGTVAAIVDGSTATEQLVMALATGTASDEPATRADEADNHQVAEV